MDVACYQHKVEDGRDSKKKVEIFVTFFKFNSLYKRILRRFYYYAYEYVCTLNRS